MNFDTAEFRRSDGPEFHNAVSAWQDGITGDGSIIAVIDTGIDEDSPEFVGRIHPDSADVAGNRGIDALDDHGTNVALVAAAARDDTGVLGIAWDAQVLAIRADDPGSCGADTPQDPSLGGAFDDRSIAAGGDLAISAGADVVNISLGGSGASPMLLNAVARAATAGVVIVVSAGNGGDGSEPGIDPDQPDPFASSLLAAGNGNVIIVGSVDEDGTISDFANRAGNDAAYYLNARGEVICCVYEDGALFVETIGGQQFVTLFSGTSFSAPQVAGAVALLAQAFPNLTGQEIVAILLDTARDAGAIGTDAIYGRGILDIAAAIAPNGTTTLAGTGQSIALADNFAIGSSAMGDAAGGQAVSAIILDKYRRAYSFDLSGRLLGRSRGPAAHADG
jgi:subtilisin family serine protease